MFSSSSPILYCACLLAIGSNVIGSPSPSLLTFQVEPNNIPASSGDDSFEHWSSEDAFNSHDRSPAVLSSLQEPQPVFDRPFAPPRVFYNTFLPVSAPLPIFDAFQNVINRLLSIGMANNNFHHHRHVLPKPIDCSKYTIGEVLDWTLHHTPKPSSDGSEHPPPLHRLAWLVNISHPVREALYDPDADFTLFAPDDEALTPPWKRKHHSRNGQLQDAYKPSRYEELLDHEASHIFWEVIEAIENETVRAETHSRQSGAEQHDDDKEKKKKFFLHAVELVLKYHLSPGRKTLREIVDSSTLPTELRIAPGSGAARFRLRVGSALPHHHKPGEIILNFCAQYKAFKTRPILTKNGVIYIIQRVPLLPPLSPLSELFLLPHPFSTLTTALQKTHLDKILLPHWENKTLPLSAHPDSDLGSPFGDSPESVSELVQSVLSSLANIHDCKLNKESFTLFAPTNHAFRELGPAANAFLFSPFGERILRYVLSYHIVPNLIWNTDHCDETRKNQTLSCDLESKTYEAFEAPTAPFGGFPVWDRKSYSHHPLAPLPGKVNITELLLPTLLGSRTNESLPITLVEFRHLGKGPLVRRVYIKQSARDVMFGSPPDKHAIPVVVPDGVAWGGALHLIPNLIHPPTPEGHHHRKDVQRALELSILTPA